MKKKIRTTDVTLETNQSIIWSLVQIYKSAKVICAQTDSVYLLFFFLSGVQKPTQASQILGHISAKTNGVKLKRKKNTPGADRMYSCCFLTAFGHAWTAFIGSIGEILHAETTLQKGGGKHTRHFTKAHQTPICYWITTWASAVYFHIDGDHLFLELLTQCSLLETLDSW